ncbi:MAG: flavin reductase family protein [Alphaproteobacteria bacterium]|nr:flavin reductase family protein [Alphaproteobacteria bacterium]MBU2378123.1 flavin reductase family protein [Alphaproteobacteria bacterium]
MSLESLPDEVAGQGDITAYRRALGAFATGVCVVTADSSAGPLGITINSFTSVSLTPRLVLWCLDERSERWGPFCAAERFSIHVLDAGSEGLARRFAKGIAIMEDHEFERVGDGPPRLADAAARFDCRVHDRIQMGDHMMIVGEVEAFEASDSAALTYFRGGYGVAGGTGE